MKPRAALAALVAVLGLALASGCGDQSGSPVGFGDTTPTGGSYLAVDFDPVDPFDPLVPGDTYDSSRVICTAYVFDGSESDGFRLYDNPGSAGFRAVSDYVADPQNAFNTGYKFFVLAPGTYDPSVTNEFVAHGARGGLENTVTAVTEHAFVPPAAPLDLVRKTPITLLSPIGTVETDTVPNLSWTAVPGATRYLVQISNTVGLQYLAIVPGNTHRVGSQPAVFVQNVPLRANFFFQWVVLAVDPYNRVIGYTPEPEGFITRRPAP